ncbi:hypothetical protein SH580_01715 [Coraliomargarita algicola]|uniref:Uncharacterized protein n=1 Tax=Coraliomargarita algicola TaxID=3092156 RepID=A0ABZ0RMT4_9BACT|nr:hypothetical protein [Coraliomargarita sp. J2-16]WPJ96418.1 hypothetical protein SH580_01715 [Coraliomargarita sp. J2-16]
MKKSILSILITCFAVAAYGDRVARVLYYGAPAGGPEYAFVNQVNQEPQKVSLDRHNFSESFDLTEGSIRLYFLPSLLAEDAPVPESAPSVYVPEDWSKVLILAFQDKNNPTMPIRLKAINANDDVFAPGGVYFVNFSEMTVFLMVGDKELISQPHSLEMVTKPIKERGSYLLKLATFKDNPNKYRPLVQQKCQYHPDVRVLTFVSPMPPPRMVKLYSVPIPNF